MNSVAFASIDFYFWGLSQICMMPVALLDLDRLVLDIYCEETASDSDVHRLSFELSSTACSLMIFDRIIVFLLSSFALILSLELIKASSYFPSRKFTKSLPSDMLILVLFADPYVLDISLSSTLAFYII